MAQIAFNLHPAQAVIHDHKARFKIVAAGRRFGKTVFSIIRCFEEALATENKYGIKYDSSSEVIYVGIDREQAKRNAWPYVLQFAREIEKATGLVVRTLEKTSLVHLPPELGGCRIRLLGMDDPDAARGMKLRYAVLDEYADMPPRVWPEIIRPALADVRGGALFIGTPKGRNHFYELVEKAVGDPDWGVFNYSMDDNPLIQEDERKALAKEYTNGSEDLYEQEVKAKFVASEGQLFRADQFKVIDQMPSGYMDTFIAVDLAGFASDPDRKKEMRRLDSTAIAIVSVDEQGKWYIKQIQHGQWDTRETAYRIVKAAKDHQVPIIGIEKGALMNAVEPYMRDYMAKYNRWFEIKPLTHGNQKKFDRVQWALQGRAQKGEIYLLKGDWNSEFVDQCVSFPSRYVHDDLVDAVAYIDQMVQETIKFDIAQLDSTKFEPLDPRAGY
jgi:predicted phage terminase large subunit-like protein